MSEEVLVCVAGGVVVGEGDGVFDSREESIKESEEGVVDALVASSSPADVFVRLVDEGGVCGRKVIVVDVGVERVDGVCGWVSRGVVVGGGQIHGRWALDCCGVVARRVDRA